MIAGPEGSAPLTFFFASATAAKYERLACNRRMQSAYSCDGGLDGVVLAPTPADFGGSPGLLFNALAGSVAEVGEVGDCCP